MGMGGTLLELCNNYAFTDLHWYVNTCRKTPLEINFMYLDKKEIYCIFKMCCIISVLFSTKCHLFHNFIFLCSNNTYFVNRVLKFTYPPWQDDG